MTDTIDSVLKDLKSDAEKAEQFSQALWGDGDKPNSHFQEGFSKGILAAVKAFEEVHAGGSD